MRQQLRDQILSYVQTARTPVKKKISKRVSKPKSKPTAVDGATGEKVVKEVSKYLASEAHNKVSFGQITFGDDLNHKGQMITIGVDFDSTYHFTDDTFKKVTAAVSKVLGRRFKFSLLSIKNGNATLFFEA